MTEADLVRSAIAKRNAGQNISPAERKALERAEKARFVASLRTVSAPFFNEWFGIQNKTRYEWEEQLKIPCGRGRDTIDMFEVATALVEVCSKRAELNAGTGLAEKKEQKVVAEIDKLREQIIQLKSQNEMLAGQRLPRTAIVTQLERMAAIIRNLGNLFARKSKLTGRDAQRMLNGAIDQWDRELDNVKQS